MLNWPAAGCRERRSRMMFAPNATVAWNVSQRRPSRCREAGRADDRHAGYKADAERPRLAEGACQPGLLRCASQDLAPFLRSASVRCGGITVFAGMLGSANGENLLSRLSRSWSAL